MNLNTNNVHDILIYKYKKKHNSQKMHTNTFEYLSIMSALGFITNYHFDRFRYFTFVYLCYFDISTLVASLPQSNPKCSQYKLSECIQILFEIQITNISTFAKLWTQHTVFFVKRFTVICFEGVNTTAFVVSLRKQHLYIFWPSTPTNQGGNFVQVPNYCKVWAQTFVNMEVFNRPGVARAVL